MLIEIEQAIINRLKQKGIPAEAWSGKPDELFYRPKAFPTARLVIDAMDFQEMHYTGHYGVVLAGSCLVFFRSLKEKGQGAYEVIENILNAITGFEAWGFDLRIKSVKLMYHESAEFCYQIQFTGYGKYIVSLEDSEILAIRIKTYEGEALSSEVSK
ncbi:hypothetical protein [Thermodesulfovibrio thiophilus]|uniref:hypothetical protein n=1 Tax=Thermodesulfovibrio thiophilus TaxID=340095 RepID=UPI0004279356|nr:hypothetical protein [Thermodesulfovibrio thiophilus]